MEEGKKSKMSAYYCWVEGHHALAKNMINLACQPAEKRKIGIISS